MSFKVTSAGEIALGVTRETTTKKKSRVEKTVLATAGEIFADGSVLELVGTGPENANALRLLFWNGRKIKIAPEIEHGGHLYRPLQVHETILRAVPLPSCAASFGSTSRLLGETAALFEKYLGLPTPESMMLAGWAATTWLADRTPSPAPLLISGPDMDSAVRLLWLLRCVCRRPLLLADISRSTLRDLPMALRPTVLVNQPDLPPKVRASWRASNYEGVFVPGNYGSVSQVACAKALYLGLESPSDPWCDSAFHITLSTPRSDLPLLDAAALAASADHFQQKYLMWRLEKVVGIAESWQAPGQLSLPACLADEPGFTTVVAALVERTKKEALARNQCDINRVIIEVIWRPSHEQREISVDNIRKLANTLLRSRGEILDFNNVEIGCKMRNLELFRHRNGDGKLLKFSRDARMRIHRLVHAFGLDLPAVSGCPDCTSSEVVVA